MISSEESRNSIRSLRLFRWTAIAIGILWCGALVSMSTGQLVLEPGPATRSNPCPSCAADPYFDVAMALLGSVWLFFSGAAIQMRFVLFASGPDKVRFAASLLLVGLIGLAPMGIGLLCLIPGLLMFASSTDEVPWLSLSGMAMMVLGGLALVPVFLFASSEPWSSLLFLPPALFGLGWIRIGLKATYAESALPSTIDAHSATGSQFPS